MSVYNLMCKPFELLLFSIQGQEQNVNLLVVIERVIPLPYQRK